MARSRCLPERGELERLLAGAGVRAGRSVEPPGPEGEVVRFDDAPTASRAAGAPQLSAPPPMPAPVRSPMSPEPGLAGGPRGPRTATIDTRSHERPRGGGGGLPGTGAEPSDERLVEEVFGAPVRSLGVEQRLQKLVGWLVSGVGASSAFVADVEGLPLVNRGTPEPYIVAIGPLARAQAEIARFVPAAPSGTSLVELDPKSVLEVVWAETPIGRLGVGLVVPEPLQGFLVARIRRVAALSVVSRGDI